MAIIIPAILNDGQVIEITIQDGAVSNAKLANSAVTINSLSVDLGSSIVLDTDDIGEGTSNLYFTDERVDDRVSNLLQAGPNVSLVYDDVANTLTISAVEDNLSNNTTDDLAEGSTNLYFTDVRATDAVEAASSLDIGNLTYNTLGTAADRWFLRSNDKIEIADGQGAGDFTWLNSNDIYLGTTSGIQINNTDIQSWGPGANLIDINTNTNIKDNLIGVIDWGGFGLDANGIECKAESGTNKWASVVLKEWDKSNQHFGIFYPNVTGFIADGTETSPQPISNGDIQLIMNGFGQWGTGTTDLHHSTEIAFRANENYTSTNRGSAITFRLTPNGTSNRTECLYWDASSTENKLNYDGGGNFTRTRFQSGSTDGFAFASDTTFWNQVNIDNVLKLKPTDVGNLPASPDRGSVAFLQNDSTPTLQNKPIYYDGSVWRYFSNDTAI